TRARPEAPVVLLGNLQHAVAVPLVAGSLRGSEKAVVEGGVGPLDVVLAFRLVQLPVRDLLHGFEDVTALQARRNIGGKRPGIVGLAAGGGKFVGRTLVSGLRGLCRRILAWGEKRESDNRKPDKQRRVLHRPIRFM